MLCFFFEPSWEGILLSKAPSTQSHKPFGTVADVRSQSPTSKGQGIGNARLLLKTKLFMLNGFPFDEAWLVVPLRSKSPPALRQITRSDLSKATYAKKKLVGEFPGALPKLVGDAEKWEQRVTALLDLVKRQVNHGNALPDSLFSNPSFYPEAIVSRSKAIAVAHPDLVPFLNALSWLLATKGSQAKAYLSWTEQLAEPLVGIFTVLPPRQAMPLAVQLAHVGATTTVPSQEFMRLLATPTLYRYPPRHAYEHIVHAISCIRSMRRMDAEMPAPSLPGLLAECAHWLTLQSSKTQKQFHRLFSLASPLDLHNQWAKYWMAIEKFTTKADHLQANHAIAWKSKPHRVALALDLEGLKSSVPLPYREDAVLQAMQWFAKDNGAFYKPMLAILEQAQTRPLPVAPVRSLVYWYRFLREQNYIPLNKKQRMLNEYSSYVATENCDISPWTSSMRSSSATKYYNYGFSDSICEADNAQIPTIFATFALYNQSHAKAPPLAEDTGDDIVQLIQNGAAPALAVALCLQLKSKKQSLRWRPEVVIKGALTLCKTDQGAFTDLMLALSQLDDLGDESLEQLLPPLFAVFAEQRPSLVRLFLQKDKRIFIDCMRRVACLNALGISLSPIIPGTQGRAPDWIAQFPVLLREELAILAALSSQAEKTAWKLSKGIVPNPRAIQTEMSHLREQIQLSTGESRVRQKKRLSNLETRAHSTAAPSESQQLQLRNALQDAIARALLDTLLRSTTDQLEIEIAKFLGCESIPLWATKEENIATILGSFILPPGDKALAHRLFRDRLGPAPWDLREDPANRNFLLRMEAKGIAMQPWIDSAPVHSITAKGKITLDLAKDPLEIFRMGAHFKTCLSPSAFNFFSVFANAADINKQVLYAVDESKKVLGRQLLCLNNKGEIVSFHAYSHDKAWEFPRLSEEFVTALCKSMNTQASDSGPIATLVAGQWYDDGAIGNTESLGLLDPDSDFARTIPKISVDLFVRTLRDASLLPTVECFVPALLRLQSYRDRPPLALAIFPHLDLNRLDGWSIAQLAYSLETLGEECLLQPLLPRIYSYILEHFRAEQHCNMDAINLLVRHAPSLALRALRTTRSRGVRDWSSESNPLRMIAIATSLLKLKRPKQANTLLEKALSTPHDKQYSKTAIEYFNELLQTPQP